MMAMLLYIATVTVGLALGTVLVLPARARARPQLPAPEPVRTWGHCDCGCVWDEHSHILVDSPCLNCGDCWGWTPAPAEDPTLRLVQSYGDMLATVARRPPLLPRLPQVARRGRGRPKVPRAPWPAYSAITNKSAPCTAELWRDGQAVP